MTKTETFQTEQINEISRLLEVIKSKSNKFFEENKFTWYGELGYVREALQDISKWLPND